MVRLYNLTDNVGVSAQMQIYHMHTTTAFLRIFQNSVMANSLVLLLWLISLRPLTHRLMETPYRPGITAWQELASSNCLDHSYYIVGVFGVNVGVTGYGRRGRSLLPMIFCNNA